MTNQEIQKRFLFDLGMGIFKVDITKVKQGIIFKTTDISLYENIYKIADILEKYGYNHMNFSRDREINRVFEKEMYERLNAIVIFPNLKKFKIAMSWNKYLDIPYNDFPDYIKEYTL